jgi:cell division protein FtsW (lipid II flippase)
MVLPSYHRPVNGSADRLYSLNDDDTTDNLNDDMPVHTNEDAKSKKFWKYFSSFVVVLIVCGVAASQLKLKGNDEGTDGEAIYQSSASVSVPTDESSGEARMSVNKLQPTNNFESMVVRTKDTVVTKYTDMSDDEQKALFQSFQSKYSIKVGTALLG